MEINQYVFLQLILSSIPLIDLLDSHGLVLWLCFLAWKTNRIYHLWIIIHYIFQGHFGSYGIDWEGPIPDTEPTTVEVPSTSCPLTDDQVNLLERSNNLSHQEGLELYTNIINQI